MKFLTVSPIAILLQLACLTLATDRLSPELAGYYTAREPLHSLFGNLAVSGPTKNVLQTQVQVLPDLIVSSRMPYKPPFVFMIIDPDTSTTGTSSSTGTLHTLVDNISSSAYYAVNQSRLFTSTFPSLAPYIGPKQAEGEASHNYTLFLFARPSGFSVPSEYQRYLSATDLAGRTGFPMGKFTAQMGLGQPIAAMYFRLKLTTSTPKAGNGNVKTTANPSASVTWTKGPAVVTPTSTSVSSPKVAVVESASASVSTSASASTSTRVSTSASASANSISSASSSATETYSVSKTAVPTAAAWVNSTGNSTVNRSLASGRNAMDLLGKSGLACFVVAAMFVFAA